MDNQTLLFSLVLLNAVMALSLTVVSWGREHDSLKKWAGALALESLVWMLGVLRGEIPDAMSFVLAGTLFAAVQSLKLAAIYEFGGMAWSRLQCLLPVILIFLLLVFLPYEDVRHRLAYSSLIYGAQFLMMVQVLRGTTELRTGRAWWLLFGATVAILPLFALRAIVSFFGLYEFSMPDSTLALNPVQLAIFVALIMVSVMGSTGFILMIKEKADHAIRALAMIDSLTGIFNRRAFMERAEKEYAMAQRNKLPLVLLMLDIDHFKRINDKYGHPTGDAALVEVARILDSRLRKQDTLGRFGGEEFCILLPATDEAGALALAEKLRLAVEGTPLVTERHTISVTVSIGVTVCLAGCSNCGMSFHKLIDDADAALYQAKRDGRNRTVILPLGCVDA